MKKIEKPKFCYLMADLAEVFEKLSDTQIDIYFDHLNHLEEYWLGKGINILIEEHPFKRFPLIREITDAVKEAHNRSIEESPEPPKGCEVCNYTGLKMEGNGAGPCSCPLGGVIAKGWKRYLSGKYKFRRQIKEAT